MSSFSAEHEEMLRRIAGVEGDTGNFEELSEEDLQTEDDLEEAGLEVEEAPTNFEDFVFQAPLADIFISPNRLREASSNTRALEDSMRENGLFQPIILRLNPNYSENSNELPYILVAGLNRLTAARKLEWVTIPSFVRQMDDLRAELIEIDENLQRHELTTMQRAKQLEKRQQVYNRLHGIKERSRIKDKSGKKVKRFDKNAEETLGMAAATIRQEVALAKKIDDEAARILVGTAVADNKKELMRLAELDKVFQPQLAQIIKEQGVSVAEAQSILKKTEPLVPDITETNAEKLVEDIEKLHGISRHALRLLPEIDFEGAWDKEVMTDFRDQLFDIKDNIEKLITAYSRVLAKPQKKKK